MKSGKVESGSRFSQFALDKKETFTAVLPSRRKEKRENKKQKNKTVCYVGEEKGK